MDPLDRIVRTYDRAIAACEAFDSESATRHLRVLREALDLDSPTSRSFDALYEFCEHALRERDFIGPARCLRSLRAAWCHAIEPSPSLMRPGLPIC